MALERNMEMDEGVPSKLQTFGFSFWMCNTALWFILYLISNYKLQPLWLQKSDSRLGKWYRTECTANQINCTSLTSSTVHAFLTIICGAYIVFYDEAAGPNSPDSSSNLIKWTHSMSLGYFLSDYIVLIHTRELGGTYPLLIHHTTATTAYVVGLWYSQMGWYSAFRVLSEFSTPFVNLRWILVALGLKDTRRYKINGILMTLAFFLCRILSFPFYWYYVSKVYYTEPFKDITIILEFFWIGAPAMLDVLNCFWFYRMFKGMLKALKKNDLSDEEARKKSEERMRRRDKVKEYVKSRYANLKSIVLRRKAIGKRSN